MAIISEFEPNQRLDKTVASLYPKYSRSAIEKLIISGQVLVNGKLVKTKYTLKTEDKITIDFSELEKAPEKIELPIIYEDENVVVINKPIGVLAHTKGAFSKEGTVASWLKSHSGAMLSEAEEPDAKKNGYSASAKALADRSTDAQNDKQDSFWESNRAGIVHRLDRGTSGVMIMAKNKETQDYLQGQFSKRNVKKTYIAVVSGKLPKDVGIIDIPIERNPKKPALFRAGVNGKSAQTEFKVLDSNEKRSLVELKPITGRTHQLRVHLAYLKNPIVGDDFYGREIGPRLLLHAKSLEITLPGSERKVFEAQLPEEFKVR